MKKPISQSKANQQLLDVVGVGGGPARNQAFSSSIIFSPLVFSDLSLFGPGAPGTVNVSIFSEGRVRETVLRRDVFKTASLWQRSLSTAR